MLGHQIDAQKNCVSNGKVGLDFSGSKNTGTSLRHLLPARLGGAVSPLWQKLPKKSNTKAGSADEKGPLNLLLQLVGELERSSSTNGPFA
ncbi:MAG: hypothetical protein Q4B54_12100 [Coriobacteriales bacterium]|nr:hypothetical protein [Coriobacteriales bacterium]